VFHTNSTQWHPVNEYNPSYRQCARQAEVEVWIDTGNPGSMDAPGNGVGRGEGKLAALTCRETSMKQKLSIILIILQRLMGSKRAISSCWKQ
jgi:hypothetical protein